MDLLILNISFFQAKPLLFSPEPGPIAAFPALLFVFPGKISAAC
jgi:hypothetical protein